MNIRLMKLRKAAGYSNRDEFAEKIGVNKYTYRSWESGAAMMNAEQIWNLSIALGCSPNDILGWNDETCEFDNVDDLSSDEREMIDHYRESSPEWQQNIAMTAKAAARESKED
ncbi:MAG: helix-turn-helix domain-containing protein [Collinsella sp.]